MRYRSSYESPKESSGKTTVILIVIVTCAVSFALGYFVGKTNVKDRPERYQIVASSPKGETVKPIQPPQPAPNEQTNTPPTLPIVKSEKTPEPQQPSEEKDKNSNKSAATVKQEKKESSTEAKASSYTVQVGAFKNQKDAETLKKKLEKKGHKAYIKKITAAKNIKLYKVRVGSFASKEDAESLRTKLKKEGFKPFITSRNKDAGE